MAGSEWFSTRPGGLNRYFESLFAALAALPGVSVGAAAFGEAPPGGSSWGQARGGLLRRVHSSREPVSTSPPDIVDRHFAPYGPPPRAHRPAPVQVVHFHGPWAGESAAAGASPASVAAKRLVEVCRYRSADHLVVLSRPFRAILVNDYSIEPGRVSVIPPGVDLSRFMPVPERAGHPVVLCVRRLERRMGVQKLIEAWPAIARSAPQAELRIVGTGSFEPALREQAGASSATTSIRFLGRLTDAELVRAYAEATVTVVPSIDLEGFGLIALESLAAGRAPIVTDCGGLPDAVYGLDPTLVVKAGSTSSIAKRVISALQGERPTPQACRAHAEGFTWAEVARRHRELYDRLLGTA